MRKVLRAGFPAVLVAACFLDGGGDGSVRSQTFDSADDQREPRVEDDLRLRLTLKGPKFIPIGSCPQVEATLVNVSRTVTHPTVRPSDGSAFGLREPHVYWTATIDRGDGKPTPMREYDKGHCGFWDYDWLKDVVSLKPGAALTVPIRSWFLFIQAGRVRLVAHYDYSADRHHSGSISTRREHVGGMIGVPDFHITSDPVEFEVGRPVDVRIRATRNLKVGEKVRASDVFDARVVNQTQESIEYASPTPHAHAWVGLEFGVGTRSGLKVTELITAYRVGKTLHPGEPVPLLGSGSVPGNGENTTLECLKPGVYPVRVGYLPCGPSAIGVPCILSEWTNLVVEP